MKVKQSRLLFWTTSLARGGATLASPGVMIQRTPDRAAAAAAAASIDAHASFRAS